MKSFRCKHCKDKNPIESEIILSWVSRFCSKKCRLEFARVDVRKTKERLKLKAKNARETVPMLKRKADKIFSEYIRRKYSDHEWNISCISCDKVLPWKESHNCHWIGRGNKQYRYDEDNCKPWCAGCNTFNQEFHQRIFTVKQVKRLWQDVVDIMLDNVNYPFKQWKTELKEIIIEFTEKLNALK